MRSYKWIKTFFATLLGMLTLLSLPGQAEKNNGTIKLNFSKNDLINQLKMMKRTPNSFEVVTAMCYKTAAPEKSINFQCPKCNKTTLYQRSSDAGWIIERMPYITGIVNRLPYDMAIDTTGFCSNCGKSEKKNIKVSTHCFNCKKEFGFSLDTWNDVENFGWLNFIPGEKDIQGNELGVWTSPEAGIKKGADYISTHVFCPKCRKKLDLER
ncbi:MAG: hypothetical protein WCV91_06645 [Candidatus Margulisiibacteriota bacterium]